MEECGCCMCSSLSPLLSSCISLSLFGVVASNHRACFMSTPAGGGIRQRNKEKSAQIYIEMMCEKEFAFHIVLSSCLSLCHVCDFFFPPFPFFFETSIYLYLSFSLLLSLSLPATSLFFGQGCLRSVFHPSSPPPPPALDNKTHQKEEDHMFADREGEKEKKSLSQSAKPWKNLTFLLIWVNRALILPFSRPIDFWSHQHYRACVLQLGRLVKATKFEPKSSRAKRKEK